LIISEQGLHRNPDLKIRVKRDVSTVSTERKKNDNSEEGTQYIILREKDYAGKKSAQLKDC
jgi:hypothetical protein